MNATEYRRFPSGERGYADYGWLKAHYSFSFAGWYDPEKIHFGALRVLNDDIVVPHSGFETHAHKDMEIITIMPEGCLTHEDNMGNRDRICKDEVQIMSAGTGIFHSEKNEGDCWAGLFQIWIYPACKGITPQYDKKKFYCKEKFPVFACFGGW